MQRNHGIDFLKFLCCFFVISIHAPFPEPLKSFTMPLARMAVPVFFIISGYYFSTLKKTGRLKPQIKKIFRLFISGNLLYFLWQIILALINGTDIASLLQEMFTPASLLHFVFLNESPFEGHLWYVGAILYTLLIVYFWNKKHSSETLYPFIPLLLLTDLFLGKYSLLLFEQAVPYVFVRNFIFVGLPYFLLGDMLFNIRLRIKKTVLILLTAVFCFTTLLEKNILDTVGLITDRDHYLSTTFLAVSVFLLAANSDKKHHGKLYKKLCFIGSGLSLNIFVLHPIFIDILRLYIKNDITDETVLLIYNYSTPFMVFLVSALCSYILYIIKNMLKNKKKKSAN